MSDTLHRYVIFGWYISIDWGQWPRIYSFRRIRKEMGCKWCEAGNDADAYRMHAVQVPCDRPRDGDQA